MRSIKPKKERIPIADSSNDDVLSDTVRLKQDIKSRKNIMPKSTNPLYHPSDINCELRSDKPTKGLTTKQAMSNTKKHEGSFFVSIKTINKDEA